MDICTQLKIQFIKDIGGEGRNSNVFLAHDPQLNANLVVKQIPKSDFSCKEEYFDEARKLYATSHPNIMQVRYACEDASYIYLSMPYCKNGSINSLINSKFLTVREIINLSLDFLSGLHFMHVKSLVHFDLKPTNIVIADNGNAIITDFGLSRYTNSFGLADQPKLYLAHRPPESLLSTSMSNAADIYMAGLTLYRMCNGNYDFNTQFATHNITSTSQFYKILQDEKFPNRKSYLPHIPLKLRKVINKALSFDPACRHSTVLEMINELSNIEDLLDWIYNKDVITNSEIWSNDTGAFIEQIHLCTLNWQTKGKKVRKQDGRETNLNKFNSQCSDRPSALKKVYQLIKNN